VGEPLAQRRDRLALIDRGDLVVAAPVPDASRLQLPCQPLAAVEVNLNLVGCPGLQPHMHPPEFGIDQIQVIVQAFAWPHLQTLGLPVRCDRERAAGLDHRQHAHQPLRHPIPLGNRPRPGLLGGARTMRAGVRQILDRPLRRRRKRHDMSPDPVRLEEPSGVLQQNRSPRQVAAERAVGEEAVEMPLEDHPVERVDHARE
jgi:hypothetical protein